MLLAKKRLHLLRAVKLLAKRQEFVSWY